MLTCADGFVTGICEAYKKAYCITGSNDLFRLNWRNRIDSFGNGRKGLIILALCKLLKEMVDWKFSGIK
jgi:hypothetical protein